MNQCLIFPSDIQIDGNAHLTGRRHQHLLDILRTQTGDKISVGLLNHQMGSGLIVSQDAERTCLQLELEQSPPAATDLTVVLALPRPNMLKRSLQNMAALGIKEIYLIHSRRVEKSFWSSPLLKKEAIENELVLGLEQAKDTVLPNVYLRQQFKPFVEDELADLAKGRRALVAHPSDNSQSVSCCQAPSLVAIGPEGGFIDYEVDLMQQAGLKSYSLGPRILRVETAVPVLISKIWQL